jgi:hypothetical protein
VGKSILPADATRSCPGRDPVALVAFLVDCAPIFDFFPLQMSAMQGNAEACFALWEILGESEGGLEWLEKAALRQHEEAGRVFTERGYTPQGGQS